MHGCGRRGKKAGGNHDQARIWASKVRVRTQLRTRNAITRVSKSPSRSGRLFSPAFPSFLLHRVCIEERARKIRPSVDTSVLQHRKKLNLSAVYFIEESLKGAATLLSVKYNFTVSLVFYNKLCIIYILCNLSFPFNINNKLYKKYVGRYLPSLKCVCVVS